MEILVKQIERLVGQRDVLHQGPQLKQRQWLDANRSWTKESD